MLLFNELKKNPTKMFYAEQITKELIYSNLMRRSLSKPQINELLDIYNQIIKGDTAYYVITDEGEFILFISQICNCKRNTKKVPKTTIRKTQKT